MHVSKRRSAVVFLSGAVVALFVGASASLAEDVPAASVAPSVAAPLNAVPAAPSTEGSAAEDGTLELNESPYSVGPGEGGVGPMCPHHGGKAVTPSV